MFHSVFTSQTAKIHFTFSASLEALHFLTTSNTVLLMYMYATIEYVTHPHALPQSDVQAVK